MSKLLNQIVFVQKREVHYKECGEGYPLLLIHGLSGSTKWWRRNINTLSLTYHVYLIDLPGFGSMRNSPRHASIYDTVTWVYEWMVAVGITKMNVIGHSMGGLIASYLAIQYPDKIHKLVLVSPAGVAENTTLLNYTFSLVKATRYLHIRFMPILIIDALTAGPLTLFLVGRELSGKRKNNDMNKILLPTLLVWGENDTLIPPQIGIILQKEIRNSEFIIIKKAGHVVMFDQPHQFNTKILSFLKE